MCCTDVLQPWTSRRARQKVNDNSLSRAFITDLFVFFSICPFVRLSACPSVHLSCVYLCISLYVSVYLCIFLSICLSICPFIYLAIYLLFSFLILSYLILTQKLKNTMMLALARIRSYNTDKYLLDLLGSLCSFLRPAPHRLGSHVAKLQSGRCKLNEHYMSITWATLWTCLDTGKFAGERITCCIAATACNEVELWLHHLGRQATEVSAAL